MACKMKNDNVASESVQLTTNNMSLKKLWNVYSTYLVNVRNGNLRVPVPCNLETMCAMHFAYIYNI